MKRTLLGVFIGLFVAYAVFRSWVSWNERSPASASSARVVASESSSSNAPRKKVRLDKYPALAGAVANFLQTGNELDKAMGSGLSLTAFSSYSARLRGQLETLQQLWPSSMDPETLKAMEKLDVALEVTEGVWKLYLRNKERDTNFVNVKFQGNEGLMSLAMVAIEDNQWGTVMTFTDPASSKIEETSHPISGKEPRNYMEAARNGAVEWAVMWTDMENQEHPETQNFLTLTSRRYKWCVAHLTADLDRR